MALLHGMFVLAPESCEMIYGPDVLQKVGEQVKLIAPPMTPAVAWQRPELLAQVEVLFSGWGGARLDAAWMAAMPRLRALFHGAGSLASIATDAVWQRDLTVTTALAANAVPVAEYSLATILFSLKHGWRLARQTRELRSYPDRNHAPGCFQRTVGLISLGTVGKALLKLLRPFDLQVIVYDPFLSPAMAAELGVEKVSLDDVFTRSDVASLHAPWLDETIGMITGRHLGSMKPGATFINTARAQIVRQDELIAVAESRQDLQFVLDVVMPEPPEASSLLYTLPNVVLTPHMAGSVGHECRRMGLFIVEELKRYLSGELMLGQVTADSIQHTCHLPVSPVPKRGVEKQPAVRVTLNRPGGVSKQVKV
jgi:phosphoglycerate dehydrogenase-like enzyme